MASNPYLLTAQGVHKGLLYLAESLQNYWPAKGELAENNIALHLARSFAEKGFHMRAEVPLDGDNRRLDFLACNYTENIAVALEFKRSIDTPQGNYEDLKRLVYIHKNGLCKDTFDYGEDAIHRIYGIVALLFENEFVDWWHNPEKNREYMPEGKSAKLYGNIGEALATATSRYVVPLYESLSSKPQYRFGRAAYALYNENSMNKLSSVLDSQK